jgi:hypothetical protein
MVTGIFRKVNDAIFNYLDNSMSVMEILCPTILAIVAKNPYFIVLAITPYVCGYMLAIIVALQGYEGDEGDKRTENMCRISTCAHLLLELMLILSYSIH